MLPDSSNLSAFADEFRRLLRPSDDLGDRLRVFLEQARPLLLRQGPQEPEAPGPDFGKLSEALDQLREPLAISLSRGDGFNPWTAARLGWDEVRNTAVLGQFLDAGIMGSRAIQMLDRFFRSVERRAEGGTPTSLPLESALQGGYSISREVCPMGDKSDRIDLLIEGADFLIGIEVKIGASEGTEQLRRYSQSLLARAGRKSVFLIYLTRHGKFPENELNPVLKDTGPGVKRFPATWRDVAGACEDGIPRKRGDWTFNDHLLSTFAAHIQTF